MAETEGIRCPSCKHLHDDVESKSRHTSYHGEDGPEPFECEECEYVFLVTETVIRGWESSAVSPRES